MNIAWVKWLKKKQVKQKTGEWNPASPNASLKDGHRPSLLQVNLLPKKTRKAILLPYAAAVLLILWLVFCAMNVYSEIQLKSMIYITNQSYTGSEKVKNTLEQKIAALNRKNGNSHVQTELHRQLLQLEAGRVDASKRLKPIYAALPNQASITQYQYSKNKEIDISCLFPSFVATADYLDKLNELGFVQHVEMSSITAGGSEQYTTSYKIYLKPQQQQ